jgi:hypothetical protein
VAAALAHMVEAAGRARLGVDREPVVPLPV